MKLHSQKKRFWAGIPPLLVIGSVVVLLPLFAFMTIQNINRQNQNSIRLLTEKGAALIRSFEAGTRSGMRGVWWSDRQLQRLLTETAQQPDIIHLIVTDQNGSILAHNDLTKVGLRYGEDLDLKTIARSSTVEWRQAPSAGNQKIFEVFRKFSPTGSPVRRHRGAMMFHRQFGPYPDDSSDPSQPSDRIIFVGLDMNPVEAARISDTRHTVIMGAILLLIGFAGILLVFIAQSYRATRVSLSRVKAFSDNLVDNMPIGLVAMDSNKKIASLNHVAESVLGLSTKEIGRDAEDVLPEQMWRQTEMLRPGGGSIERETECVLSNGKAIPLEISASVFHDENNLFLGYILLFKDLSEVHALRREIARSQRLASVGKLAAGVAHEIRNPLSSIKGFATYFKERYQEKTEDRHIADVMIQEVDRLNRVVGQLLEFARPITVSKKSIPIQALVEDSLKLIEQQSNEKRIRVETRFQSDVHPISVDPDRINQVLLNLYLNALESMNSGGRLIVCLKEDKEKKRIRISISDTGVGIRKEDIPHIFDPYYTTKTSGTGLGLAIVHNILEGHGGEMTVESRVGEGTTFTLLLPYE